MSCTQITNLRRAAQAAQAVLTLIGFISSLTASPVLLGAELPASRTVAFVGGSLIDGTASPIQSQAVIVVRGEQIIAAGAAREVQIPPKAQIVHVDGQFVIPGLINSHVHLATSPDPRQAKAYLRRELYSGVTAVRDMAGDERLLAKLKRESAADHILAPDIYYSALVAGPAFFGDPRTHEAARGFEPGTAPWMQAITPDTQLPLAIAAAHATGATGIKIYADLPASLVSAVTAEAHRQHMLVWAHATVFPAGPSDVANAGVDVMSHADLLAYQLSAQVPPSYAEAGAVDPRAWRSEPAMDSLLELMKTRGIILDATIDVGVRHPIAKWPPGLAAFITSEAYRRGVMISAGTDDDLDLNEADSLLDAEIIRLVREAGVTPADAIRSATAIGARTIGEQDSMGTLEPGKLANFVLLQRNPLDDIGNIRSITEVVKRGVRYSRSAYHPDAAVNAKK
jgi:imidazolonepropionase-like amidohydrolase